VILSSKIDTEKLVDSVSISKSVVIASVNQRLVSDTLLSHAE